MKMKHILNQITETLKAASNPVVLCSFGKDSLLLLALARQVMPGIPILYFRDRVSPFAKQVIIQWDLTVFGYAPINRYLVPWGRDITLVDEISLGGSVVPLLRDVVLSEGYCQIERLSPVRTPYFHYNYDVTLWGYRKADERHPSMPTPFADDLELPTTRMVAPFYGLSDEQIRIASESVKMPISNTQDSISMCASCLKALESNWNKRASLDAFERRFGYAKAA